MRRGYVLFAMIAVAAVGGSAEAGLDPSPAGDPILDRIQAFIADQRRADAASCAALGRTDIEICVRDLAGQRRARLAGPVADRAREQPAGTDI
jgi:hypothetical protein